MNSILALLTGWGLDLLLGDPRRWPHPVVWFGRCIAWCEHRLNRGSCRRLKGAATAVLLIVAVFISTCAVRRLCASAGAVGTIAFDAVTVFYCLAGTTLIREVRQVFHAVDRSLDEGRQQVARIVGRDTSQLSAQEVRTAALETLAENLSDGVVAPLFWLALLGTPGMMAYKMVNTLDSMIGYRTDRYRRFGCWAARIDDVANYVPARLSALLMIAGEQSFTALLKFVRRYGRCHASPNSGYPEAALAAILNCRFGGPHYYFGQLFPKPYIGHNDRLLTTADMRRAVRVNRRAEVMAVVMVVLSDLILTLIK
jgi:adenosylcobinamide-phosphate synthase